MLVCGVGAKRFVALSSNANGRLLAYDPEDMIVNADESKKLRVLWDSQEWKFSTSSTKISSTTGMEWEGISSEL